MKLQLWLLVDSHFSSISSHHLLDFPFHTVVPDVSFIGDVVQNVTEADQLQLVCLVVEAWPQPNVVWLLNSNVLQSSTHLTIMTVPNTTATDLYTTRSTLIIPQTLPDVDTGTYTCRSNQALPGVPVVTQSVDASIIVLGNAIDVYYLCHQ